jgi:hypothetical protein
MLNIAHVAWYMTQFCSHKPIFGIELRMYTSYRTKLHPPHKLSHYPFNLLNGKLYLWNKLFKELE